MSGPSPKDRGNGEPKVPPHSLSGLLRTGGSSCCNLRSRWYQSGTHIQSLNTSDAKTAEEEEKQTGRGQRDASREVKGTQWKSKEADERKKRESKVKGVSPSRVPLAA